MSAEDDPPDDVDAVLAYREWQEARRFRQPWADSVKADYERLRGDCDD